MSPHSHNQPGHASPAHVLPTEDFEAQLLWSVRFRAARTQAKQLLTDARLRTFLVISLSLLFWLGLFAIFYKGFEFVVINVGAAGAHYHAQTVKLVFHLFFASLNVMLIFSSGIILYSGLFNSEETRFLATQPIRDERIVLYKFQEAVFFSSWGFFLLASPMMIAYGLVVKASWFYFALIIPFIVSFVYIPCSIGAISCLAIVHRVSQARKLIVGGLALACIYLAIHSVWKTVSGPPGELFGTDWVNETMRRFRFTEEQWLPSAWLTGGLLEAARRYRPETATGNLQDLPAFQSCLYLAVLISNALLFHLVIVWIAKRWFRSCLTQSESWDNARRFRSFGIVDSIIGLLVSPFPRPVQLLMIKDMRLLRRDPVQWSQFLIFFGLLALYFVNIDRFKNSNSDISYLTWINMVSFLNLAVVGLILSTFTTRFIYPMISLEGHCFWVLGLMPLERDTIVWSKFLFASIGSWVPCSVLILLSDLMLRVPLVVVGVHQMTCVLLCLGLASIAVGLGAMMPDFVEQSPSKISAGFGGTLNLVLSALYIMTIVLLTALPCHFYFIANANPVRSSFWSPTLLRFWLIGGGIGAIVVGAIATIAPMRKGLQSFRKIEFV